MKIAFPHFGNTKYVEFVGHSMFEAIPHKDCIEITVRKGIQFWRTWVDKFEIVQDIPKYSRQELVRFPLQ